MVKAIVFDLGGVVFIGDGVSYKGRERLAKELNIDIEKFHDFWFERKEDMITGKLSEDDYFKEFLSLFNISIGLENFKKDIRKRNVIDKKMVDLLLLLKEKYSLYALTNDVKEWVEYRIKKFDLNKYFHLIVTSHGTGLAKPDKRIYEELIKQIDINAKELVFVDDRIE